MNYQVIIDKCNDPASAMDIAREIARRTGRTPESVYKIITAKTTCIRKEVDKAEALGLKATYESLGAIVEIVSVGAAAVRAPGGDDDDDGEASGRLLSSEEYVQKVNQRKDIFYFEGNRSLKNVEMVSLVCAILAGVFLSTREITLTQAADFFEREEVAGKFGGTVERPKTIDREEKKQPEPQISERKVLKPNHKQEKGGMTGGGGDPRARVTMKGVLGIISGQVKGKTLASADIFGKGGFATDIDAILSGVIGLKTGGDGGVGRRGETGIGFGTGYNSGFSGGSGGIGDLIDNLMSSSGSGIELKRHIARLEVRPPTMVHGGSITSGRSKASIMRVVMQNIGALRHAYNKRLRDKPGLDGKITVRFAVDEFGKVIFCQLQESTMSDADLETTVVAKIRAWKFDKIDKPGDVTEVVYPFVFSQ
jgi:TonB family protein